MICYKDRTWCPFYPFCKKGYNCDRACRQNVIDDAEKWWGGPGAPIATYAEFPECFVRWFEEEKK